MLDALEEKINQKVGEFFYGYGENLSLEEVVIDLLKTRKETLSVVEGVSGGLCQGKLTDIKGSSEVFLGGMVTYSNKSKQQLLNLAGVQSEEILAVGKEQAIKLAESIKKVMRTDYGLSIIGVAGPERVDNLPVGSIFIALATNEETISYEVLINRERDYIKDGAVKQALNLLRKKIIS
jgi:nicotinamide-nucleotide amidase